MTTVHLDDFLDDGILKEKSFREKVKQTNWSDFKNKRVLIKGCTDVPVPTWAYLIITAHLSQTVERIYFGELRSAVKIYIRDNA
jgi:hypothetical protein|tara:strand:+ start:1514 stop:1765 length:252 start_codon:yes stop_codon:yes gene_type:complete